MITLRATPVWVAAGVLMGEPAAAQVILDGTANPAHQGPLSGPNYAIGAEVGQEVGANLFHSFERFDLATGERADFSGPGGIANIISRVTGGDPSDIDGTIGSSIPGADFWFINPAGITFGPNAQLDVQGSFHVSTADEIRFADGARFAADLDLASSFTMAAPEAFGFLGAQPAALTVDRGFLAVDPGRTLALVGGDITIDGGNNGFIDGGLQGLVTAPGGRVLLASLGGRGVVLPASGVVEGETTGRITLDHQGAVATGGDGGGTIAVRAGTLRVEGQALISNDNIGGRDPSGDTTVVADEIVMSERGEIVSIARGSGDAAPIEVSAGSMLLTGSGSTSVTGVVSQTAVGSSGDAGTIRIVAGRLVLDGADAQINADAFGSGSGGRIEVSASRLEIRGDGRDPSAAITSSGQTLESLNSGSIRVAVEDELVLSGSGRIQTQARGRGRAGDIEVEAGRLRLEHDGVGLVTAIDSSTFGGGRAGDVTIDVGALAIDGGLVQSAAFSPQASGNITITAAHDVSLANGLVRASSFGGGRSGTIDVDAATIALEPGGIIGSGTLTPDVALLLPGSGGGVRLHAESISIRGVSDNTAGLFAATLGGQDAGDIEITASDLVLERSLITASSLGDVNAGSILIDVDRFRSRSGQIQSTNFGVASDANAAGDGGQITIRARDSIVLDGTPDALSGIASTILSGGRAGDITISSPSIDLTNATILASGFLTGPAGNVALFASESLSLDTSSILTTSQSAGGGQIALDVGGIIDLQESTVASSVVADVGNAGNVTLGSPFLVLDDAFVLAQANAGTGGDIRIGVDQLIASPASVINAEAGTAGIDGTVVVSSPDVDLTGGLLVLEGALLDASSALQPPCGARAGDAGGTLTGVGRDGVAPAPGDLLEGGYALALTSPRPAVASNLLPVALARPCGG